MAKRVFMLAVACIFLPNVLFAQSTQELFDKALKDLSKNTAIKMPPFHDQHRVYNATFNKDPFVRAAACYLLSGFNFISSPFIREIDDRERPYELTKEENPLVRFMAAKAFFDSSLGGSLLDERLIEIYRILIGSIASKDEFVRKKAIETLSDSLLNYTTTFENPELIEVVAEELTALLSTAIEKNESVEVSFMFAAGGSVESTLRHFLANNLMKLIERTKNMNALSFFVQNIDSFPEFRNQAYELVGRFKLKSFIPWLEESLNNAQTQEERVVIRSSLIKLGKDFYSRDDFSSCYLTMYNFYRAIRDNDFYRARQILDPKKIDEELANRIISDHVELLKDHEWSDFSFITEGECEIDLMLRPGSAGYRYGKFDNMVKVALVPVSVFDEITMEYYLKQDSSGNWYIAEVKPLIIDGDPTTPEYDQNSIFENVLEQRYPWAVGSIEELEEEKLSRQKLELIGKFEYVSPLLKGIFNLEDGTVVVAGFEYISVSEKLRREYEQLKKEYPDKRVMIKGYIVTDAGSSYVPPKQHPEGLIYEKEAKLAELIKKGNIYFIVEEIDKE